MLSPWISIYGGQTRTLSGHVPEAAAKLHPLGRLPGTNQLKLAISLPLRHQSDLTNFLERLYDPASPDYHHYLTPAEFNLRFGPTEEDYQSVAQFARSNHFSIANAHDSRRLLDITASVADIERTFGVRFYNYQHPTEARQFFAPDVDPTIDARLPILDVVGLSDYAQLHTASHPSFSQSAGATASGSQSNGYYMGNDFRNAYAPGVSLLGTGQMVGLFEADSYYGVDITNYERIAGLPNVPLLNVRVDGGGGSPGANNGEVALDIEMAISMAPGLSGVVVFEAPNNVADWLDILDYMASSNQIKQFSSSWGYTGGENPNTSFDSVFQTMAAQGQTFFQASGDGDAWVNPIWTPADSPYVTSVGGTELTMNGAGASYNAETVWNSGYSSNGVWSPNGDGYWGSGGGSSRVYSIPSWQQSAAAITPNASTNMRNIPDVALAADGIWVQYNNGQSAPFMGTSCAAPLWAGYLALVNQQAAANSDPSPGFLNPAIYTLGQGASYSSCFNDITTGNNTNAQSHGLYTATAGYDLCTGWGTPMGAGLINALAPLDNLLILPAAGFVASGGQGGPFNTSSQTYVLTNTGGPNLIWNLACSAPWLNISPSSGTLVPGGPSVNVTVALNSTASNEMVGTYSADVYFTNVTDNVTQTRTFSLDVAAPPSFIAVPSSQYVFSGSTVELMAATAGSAPQSFQWKQNGTNLSDNFDVSGSTTTNLVLENVTSANSGSYTLVASNAAAAVTSSPATTVIVLPPQPQLIQNGGFETGDFSDWTESGNFSDTYVSPGVGLYVHSGQFGAELGPGGSLGYISQTLTTTPGMAYLISLWMDSPDGGQPNEFTVSWDGNTLFDGLNLPAIGWTNMVFVVTATDSNPVLAIGFRDDPSYLGLDDISVLPATPSLQDTTVVGGNIFFGWVSVPGSQYQLQCTTNLAANHWTPLGNVVTATNIFTLTAGLPHTNTQQFYRVRLIP